MGDLSPHFHRSEFACKCGCGFNTVDAELVKMLEHIRAHFDRPITITSGCRCYEYNQTVGGSKHSQHKHGRAADFVVEGTPSHLVASLAEQINAPGVGRYRDFTHIDSRSGLCVRWEY